MEVLKPQFVDNYVNESKIIAVWSREKRIQDAGAVPARSTIRKFVKAFKSELAKRIQQAGIKIPLGNGAKLVFEGREYIVKHIPIQASLWWAWHRIDWVKSNRVDSSAKQKP